MLFFYYVLYIANILFQLETKTFSFEKLVITIFFN